TRSCVPLRSSSATRCGPSAPLAPVTSTALISMLQQQRAPAGPEAKGKEQQARAPCDPPAAPKGRQVDEGVGGDRVAEGRRALVKPVRGYPHQTQQDFPARPADAGRD